MIIELINWTNNIFMPFGSFGLFLLSFIESIFFPIPPDLLLISFSLGNRSLALWFAFVTTVGSILGAIVSYYIGLKLGKPILEKGLKFNTEKIHKLYNKYGAWVIFVGGFTPLPFKIFTLSSGIFYINFRKFVIASILGRSLRFFLEALLIMIYGNLITEFLKNYFDFISLIIVIPMLGLFIYKKRFSSS